MSDEPHRLPFEQRNAQIDGVSASERIISVIAVPWEPSFAMVPYKQEIWKESFVRGSLDNVVSSPTRIRANREHDRAMTVGKAIRLDPDDDRGLLAEVRIAKTLLGDETLALAEEDVLSSSIWFGIRGRDQELDRKDMTRRIHKAYLGHIAFVAEPAYQDAQIVGVRDVPGTPNAADMPPLDTPALDEWRAYLRRRRNGLAS